MDDIAKSYHINAALNVASNHRDRVGVPIFRGAGCDRNHEWYNRCRFCYWNYCLRCGQRPNEIGFVGWTGRCNDCVAVGFALPVVPDDWKLFYAPPPSGAAAAVSSSQQQQQQPPSSASSSGGDHGGGIIANSSNDVVVIDDDDYDDDHAAGGGSVAKTKRELLKETDFPYLPDHWTVSDDGSDVRTARLIKIYNRADSSPMSENKVEILRLVDLMERSVESQQSAKDHIPPDFQQLGTDALFRINMIQRVQNYSLLRMYEITLDEFKRFNNERSEMDRAVVIEDHAFHGTIFKHARDITLNGVSVKENKFQVYGWGFYVSRRKLNIPVHYALKNAPNDRPCLVLGRCLVGRNSQTPAWQRRPNPGDDTGGFGNDFIHVVFKDTQFYPEYLIQIEAATHSEWEQQMKEIKQACGQAVGSPSVASAAAAAVSLPPPPPPPAPAPPVPPPLPVPPPPSQGRVAPSMTGGGGGLPSRRCTCGQCFLSRLSNIAASASMLLSAAGAPPPPPPPAAAAVVVPAIIPAAAPPPAQGGGSASAAGTPTKKRRRSKTLRFTKKTSSPANKQQSKAAASSPTAAPASPQYKPSPPTTSDDDDDSDDKSDPDFKPAGGGGPGGAARARV